MRGFSDYIVYADESGSPTLDSIDENYPVFVLALVVIRKSDYIAHVVPSFQQLKFDFFGHDQTVFHERDIRRTSGAFAALRTDRERRTALLEKIGIFVANLPATVIAQAVRKDRFASDGTDAYPILVQRCTRVLQDFLASKGQGDKRTFVVFEARGAKEDKIVELAVRRAAGERASLASQDPEYPPSYVEPIFSAKSTNSTGLQIADLFARPIGRQVIKPDETNRAFATFSDKLYRGEIHCIP